MSADAFLPVALILGYLLGSIPFGLVLTKLAGTEDLRSIGSGNIGATNVLRTGRKGLAAATLLGDALKGTLAVIIAGYYGGPDAAMLAALGAFLGHLFPVWLKFRGGKGVAVYIGVLIGSVLAGRDRILRDLAHDRHRHPLLLARGAGRECRHADLPVVVRPPRARLAVRRADAVVVLHAPRKHQAVAGGHRGQDRGEEVRSPAPDNASVFLDLFRITFSTIACHKIADADSHNLRIQTRIVSLREIFPRSSKGCGFEANFS